MKVKYFSIGSALFVLLAGYYASADVPASAAALSMSAGEIIEKARAELDWKTLKIKVVLDIKEDGKSKIMKKHIDYYLRENSLGETDILLRFRKPAIVKGNVFLALQDLKHGDRWYMYVRKLRRKLKVPTEQDSYMIRGFLALDLTKPRVGEWLWAKKGVRGENVLISGKAANDNVKSRTQYTEIVYEIDTKNFTIVSADYFNEHGKVRSIKVNSFKEIQGVWLPEKITLDYYAKNQETTVTLTDYKVNTVLPATLFNPSNLEDMGY